MIYFIYFIIVFLVIYLFYLFTVVLRKKQHEKFKKSAQVRLFVKKYKLDLNKINMKKFTNLIGLTNSLIISLTFLSTFLVDNILLQLLVGLLFLIPLMLIFYSLLGNYLKRKCK